MLVTVPMVSWKREAVIYRFGRVADPAARLRRKDVMPSGSDQCGGHVEGVWPFQCVYPYAMLEARRVVPV